MEKIDAKGLACPMPIIKAKKALRSHTDIEILVDDEEAAENLEKMSQQMNYSFKRENQDEGIIKVSISRENNISSSSPQDTMPVQTVVNDSDSKNLTQTIASAMINDIRLSDGYIVVVGTNVMGHGDDKLGSILMKSFLYSLTEQDVLPEYVIFFNGGIQLLVEGSESVQDIKKLKNLGVKVLACGTCVDYYDVKEKLQVGEITNLYNILELMRKAQRIVRP